MATTTITALTAVLAANLTDVAVLATDDSGANTRKVTVAQLRTQLIAPAITFPSAITVSGLLTASSGTIVGADPGGTELLRVGGSGVFSTTLTVNGQAAIGTSATAANALSIAGILTGMYQHGINTSPSFDSTAATAATYYAQVQTAAGAFALSAGFGLLVGPPVLGAGSTITTLAGLYAQNQGLAGITTSYGLYLDPQSGATTSWSIYTNGGPHYFGGLVTVLGAFGCNGKAAQTSYASGGAAVGTPTSGGWGFTSSAEFTAFVASVNAHRSALIANGIES